MRETAKLRREREERERLAHLEVLRHVYPQTFREVLRAALNENFEIVNIDPSNGLYTLYDCAAEETYELLDAFDASVLYPFDDILSAIASKVKQRTEVERQRVIRVNALSKLNQEEREALGL